MRGTIYPDQNVLAEMDRPEVRFIFAFFAENGFDAVISSTHFLEIGKSDHPEKYIDRISSLRPSVIQFSVNPTDGSTTRSFELHSDPIERLEQHRLLSLPIELGMLQSFLPMLKLIGGMNEVSPKLILEKIIESLELAISKLREEIDSEFREVFDLAMSKKIEGAISSIRSDFSRIDFEAGEAESRRIRGLIASHGRLYQCPAVELVPRLADLLADTSASTIFSLFPKGFALISPQPQLDVVGFASALSSMGAIPGIGKMLRGPTEQQFKRFVAQQLDNRHIGEAIAASVFISSDKGAVRLAKAVYAYAGVSTQVLELKPPNSHISLL